MYAHTDGYFLEDVIGKILPLPGLLNNSDKNGTSCSSVKIRVLRVFIESM